MISIKFEKIIDEFEQSAKEIFLTSRPEVDLMTWRGADKTNFNPDIFLKLFVNLQSRMHMLRRDKKEEEEGMVNLKLNI